MKTLTWILSVLPTLALAAAPEPQSIQSEAIELAGTKAEILSRAKTCVAKLVRFDPIRVNTAGALELMAGAASDAQRFTDIPGGPVIVDVNSDTGTLVANNRTSAKFAGVFYIDSLLTIDARDGKFRITHTDIKTDARQPLGKMRGLTKPATEALINQNRALASCITTATADDF